MNRSIQQQEPTEREQSLPRVLVLTQNDGYPDDTRVALECESLCDAGYQVSVVCPTGVSRRLYENVKGVHVYRYPRPWDAHGILGYIWEYSYCLWFSFLLCLYVALRRGFDVLQARTPPDFHVLLGWFFKLLGKTYVVEMLDLCPELYRARAGDGGSRLLNKVLEWFERRNCQAADFVIASSGAQRTVMVERGGTPADRCRLVRNTPDPMFLQPAEPIAALRESGRFIIGYVGLIGVQDRVDLLILALDHLKNNLGRNDFQAVIVGSGPETEAVKKLCAERQLERQVLFTGYLTGSDLVRHVASFDIGVVPDPSNEYNDTCSMCKIMNYMAVAKPVVGFDLTENRVTAAEAALYAPANSVAELAQLMEQLMDSVELREELGRAGRHRLEHELSWDHIKPHFLDAYRYLWSLRNARQDVTRNAVRSVKSKQSGVSDLEPEHASA